MHGLPDPPAARSGTGGDDQSVNALQQLIQAWLDSDQSHSVGLLAHRADMSRNTIYAILSRNDPAGLPQKETLRKLAKGMGVPLGTVREAAATAAGYDIETQLDPESQEIQAWMALLEELPEQRRTELWEIGRMYLRRAKDEP